MAKYEQRQVLSYSASTRFYLHVKSKGEQPQIRCETMTYYNHNPSLQRAMDITVTQVWQRYYLPYAGDGAVSAPSFRRWVTAGTKYSRLAAGGASRAIHYLQRELMISIASMYFLLMMVKMGRAESFGRVEFEKITALANLLWAPNTCEPFEC